MKNLLQLKLNKNDLKNQISKLEEEYEQQDFTVRQKGILLLEILYYQKYYIYLIDIIIKQKLLT